MTADATQLIDALTKVTSRLIGVMDREVALLRDMRVREIEALQAEKSALTVSYEECVQALAAAPAALEAMAPAVRAELAALAARFDAALAENARALGAVRASHDRLVKTIVDAVAERRARRKGYSADGTFDDEERRRGADAVSLTFDRRL